MSMTLSEIYERLLNSGIADSPTARLYLEQALEPFIGTKLDADAFMEELRSTDFWTPRAEACILSAIKEYEGEILVSTKTTHFEQVKPINERLADAIREDTTRWHLSDEQKDAILQDSQMLSRWAKEYDAHDGFQYLLDYVVDDEIAEWKDTHSMNGLRSFLTRTMMIEPTHGKDCTLEICICGEPDQDKLICSGNLMSCLKKAFEYEEDRSYDEYFSLTTAKDNYCQNSFEDLCIVLHLNAEELQKQFESRPALNSRIQEAAARCAAASDPVVGKGKDAER